MFMTIIQVPTLIITTVFISLLKVSMKYLRPFSVLVNVYFRDDRKILLQILNAVKLNFKHCLVLVLSRLFQYCFDCTPNYLDRYLYLLKNRVHLSKVSTKLFIVSGYNFSVLLAL